MADKKLFRKKPVVIEAIQWDGTLAGNDDIISVFPDIRTVAKTAHPPTNKCSFWKIGTLEGSHEVSAGDFIIRGVKGEYYPCKPDIFFMTYEPATATPPADAALADGFQEWITDKVKILEERARHHHRQGAYDVVKSIRNDQNMFKAIDAALRARSAPTHNLTEQDTADIARVLCWLKYGDTPPAAEIERIVHRNAELRGIVDDLRARAVPEQHTYIPEQPHADFEWVSEICNAYESGVGHYGRPTAGVNPYRPESDLAVAYLLGATSGKHNAQPAVPDDVAKDAIPTGWVFYSADASIQSSDPRRPIGVMLKRDVDGVQWWLQLTEEEKEKTQLYSSGSGMTLTLAIQNAAAAILSAADDKEVKNGIR